MYLNRKLKYTKISRKCFLFLKIAARIMLKKEVIFSTGREPKFGVRVNADSLSSKSIDYFFFVDEKNKLRLKYKIGKVSLD